MISEIKEARASSKTSKHFQTLKVIRCLPGESHACCSLATISIKNADYSKENQKKFLKRFQREDSRNWRITWYTWQSLDTKIGEIILKAKSDSLTFRSEKQNVCNWASSLLLQQTAERVGPLFEWYFLVASRSGNGVLAAASPIYWECASCCILLHFKKTFKYFWALERSALKCFQWIHWASSRSSRTAGAFLGQFSAQKRSGSLEWMPVSRAHTPS